MCFYFCLQHYRRKPSQIVFHRRFTSYKSKSTFTVCFRLFAYMSIIKVSIYCIHGDNKSFVGPFLNCFAPGKKHFWWNRNRGNGIIFPFSRNLGTTISWPSLLLLASLSWSWCHWSLSFLSFVACHNIIVIILYVYTDKPQIADALKLTFHEY